MMKVDNFLTKNPDHITNQNNSPASAATAAKYKIKKAAQPPDNYTFNSTEWSQAQMPIREYVRTQAARNIQGTISKAQIADQAMSQLQKVLQRGKDLALKADKPTASTHDKKIYQNQLGQINQEIDRISQSFSADPKKPNLTSAKFQLDESNLIQSLKSSWLESAETAITQRYGLNADGHPMGIVMDENDPVYLAAVEYIPDETGKSVVQILHVNVQASIPPTLPNGGIGPYYDDRVISHEMVHAIMGRTMNYASLPIWFKEGTAEFLPGADERIEYHIQNKGGGMAGATAVAKALGDGTDKTWKNKSINYAAATIAVRFLHDDIKSNGHNGGIKDLFADLQAHPTENLDDALSHLSSYQSVEDFADDFVKNKKGAEYIYQLDQANKFNNTDTGGIGGADVDGGPVRTPETVIPDINHYQDEPLKHFKVIWPKDAEQYSVTSAAANGQLGFAPAQFGSETLGTKNLDMINKPNEAVRTFDTALSKVTKERNQLVSFQKQLGAALMQPTADKAAATVSAFPGQIKSAGQSGSFITAQSNNEPYRVLSLLTQ
jgi:flagellin